VRNVWFQHDGAVIHTARQSIIFVVAMLAGYLIRLGDSPFPSADWTGPQFFLWIYLKKFSS